MRLSCKRMVSRFAAEDTEQALQPIKYMTIEIYEKTSHEASLDLDSCFDHH